VSLLESKPRDHSHCLERWLPLWLEGDIDALVDEGATIQNRLLRSCSTKNHEDNACVFARLMFQGKVKAALRPAYR